MTKAKTVTDSFTGRGIVVILLEQVGQCGVFVLVVVDSSEMFPEFPPFLREILISLKSLAMPAVKAAVGLAAFAVLALVKAGL